MSGLTCFIVAVVCWVLCSYLFGWIKWVPPLPINAGATLALGIVTFVISVAALIGAAISLFR